MLQKPGSLQHVAKFSEKRGHAAKQNVAKFLGMDTMLQKNVANFSKIRPCCKLKTLKIQQFSKKNEVKRKLIR